MHTFGSSPDFTVGVEEELLETLCAETHPRSRGEAPVLARMPAPRLEPGSEPAVRLPEAA